MCSKFVFKDRLIRKPIAAEMICVLMILAVLRRIKLKKLTVIEPADISYGRKLRVGAYCRVSTEKKEQENSYVSQVNYFKRQYKYSENEELVGIYADMSSGTTVSGRTEFVRMLEDCRRGKLDRIVTKSLSRFSRNTRDKSIKK